MPRFRLLVVFAGVLLTLLGTGAFADAQQILPYFFGMSMTGGEVGTEPWPVDNFSGARLWDSGTVAWAEINSAPGVYDWRELNIWMKHAKQNHIDLLYCFGRTPTWASSHPHDTTCGNEIGSCDAPDDLNSDGSGTDQHWKDFVTAIAAHSAGRIHYWELWDEFPNPYRWNWLQKERPNTVQQLVRMAKDARAIIKSIDPTAVIVSDSGALRFPPDVTKWTQFVQAGGLKYADVIAFHGYTQPAGAGLPEPETLVGLMQGSSQLPWGKRGFLGFLKDYGYSGARLWDTEGSWAGTAAGLHDEDEQAGFAARFNLIHQSLGVQRFYWYEWDNIFAGTLWQPTTRYDLALPNSKGNVSTMLGFGDGSYQHPVEHGAGHNPVAVAVADFNNDHVADLLIVNEASDDVTTLLGRGNGIFKAGINSDAGHTPIAVAVGDFNKDGKLDAVVAHEGGSSVSVLFGRGNGTFKAPIPYAVGTNPSSIAVGDFNQDGYVDIVVTNAGNGTVSVLLNNGKGGFRVATNYKSGSGPSSVAVGDFNRDGYPDLAVTNADDGTVSVLLNHKDGTFGTAVSYPVHLNPSAVAAGFFTTAHTLDLAVANEGSDDVTVLLGDGTGKFAHRTNYNVGSKPVAIAIRDINGDGKMDIVTANQGDNTVSTLLGLPQSDKGTFEQPSTNTNVGSSPRSMAVGAFGVIGTQDPGTLRKGGFGYQASYNWTVGNTLTAPCKGLPYDQHGVWTCNYTGRKGYQAQAVWDSSQKCAKNVCTTSNYTAASKYVQYRTAYGEVFPIHSHAVKIGYIPIFLENHNP